MIFAKVYLPDLYRSQLTSLLGRTSPNLLQLDIVAPVGTQYRGENAGRWTALATSMPQVHSAIYLRPELCVVSNAGSPNAVDCISSLADFMVSHGSSELMITAIRGDNLLSVLKTILPAASLPENATVLSARLEIGGGPFAIAISEGARFIIAGSYDTSAPFLGAAVAQGLCGWEDYQELALLAAAAHFEGVAVEVGQDSKIELESAAVEQLNRVRAMAVVTHADVHADFSQLALESTHRNTLRPKNVSSASPRSMWNARIIIESGFQATALVVGSANELLQLTEHLPTGLAGGSLTCIEYVPAVRKHANDDTLIWIKYRGHSDEMCREFVDWLQLSLRTSPAVGQLIAPLPTIEQSTDTVSVQIPTDAVTVSVDTRPAQEWL